jgi:hypothetical protein
MLRLPKLYTSAYMFRLPKLYTSAYMFRLPKLYTSAYMFRLPLRLPKLERVLRLAELKRFPVTDANHT